MSYEYDASYLLAQQRTAELAHEVELRRRIAERKGDREVKPPKKVPFWVWFRDAADRQRYRPASAF